MTENGQSTFDDLLGLDQPDEDDAPAPISTLDETRQQVLAQLGETPESVGKLRAMTGRWAELMQRGVLVDLHIGRWRARTRQNPEEDLGLRMSPEAWELLRQYMPPGEKLLLPRDVLRELRGIEGGARDWLDQCSYDLPWGRFVPYTGYARWRDRNEEYRRQYFALRDRIGREYDDLLRRVRADYVRLAHEAWQRTTAAELAVAVIDADGEITAEMTDLAQGIAPTWFVESFVERALDKVPPPAELRASFTYEWDLTYIPLPSVLEADQSRAEQVRQEADLALQQAREEAALETQRRRLEREQLDEEEATLRMRQQAEAQAAREHQRRLSEMHRDIEAHYRQQKQEQVDAFIEGITAQLRELVFEVAGNVLASIERNQGKLVGKSAEQVRHLVERVQALNFTGDADIEAQIGELRQLMAQPARDRDTQSVTRALQSMRAESQAILLSLGRDLPRRRRPAPATADPSKVVPIEEVRRRRRAAVDDQKAVLVEPVVRRRRAANG